jgi:hypothetical protein
MGRQGHQKPTHRSRVSRHENFFNNLVNGGLPKEIANPGHSR